MALKTETIEITTEWVPITGSNLIVEKLSGNKVRYRFGSEDENGLSLNDTIQVDEPIQVKTIIGTAKLLVSKG